ncbi:SET domain-containing protein [Apiospora aurea]|uniref:SET domain-containing protein n=1 Tax=Apiospora aurea TaxID=335848 RepID=A0ABR1QMU0_9PEZI
MAASHPYRNLQIPDGASFELRPTSEKGWGMFATEDIQRNDVILMEKPLFIITNRGPKRSLKRKVRAAVERLTPEAKAQFFSLRRNSFEPFATLEAAFLFNKFTQEGTEHPDDEAMLLLMPRINHSCVPNAVVPSTFVFGDGVDKEASYLVVNKDIPSGTEITISYQGVVNFLTGADRRRALGFDCQCEACTYDDAHRLYLSDLRRTLLRGLDHLTNFCIGGEPEEYADPGLRPVIPDDDLYRAAVGFEIPHSSRFIYYLMMPCLLEAEGVLGDIDADTYRLNLDSFARAFETPENVEIALLATEQETWLKRFLVACHLWGRQDAGDYHNMVKWLGQFGYEVPLYDPFITSPIVEEVD